MSGEPPDLDLLSGVPDPFADDSAAMPPPPVLPTRPAPTRKQHGARLLAAALAALLFQVVWVVLSRHRVAVESLTAGRLAFGLGVPLVAAALVWVVATRRGRLGLGTKPAWLAAGIVAAPMAFALTTLAVAPADHAPSIAAFLDTAVRCVLGTGALCAVALGLGALAFRHAFAAASTWRTAALGTACGALSAATMSLACFHTEALHLLVGHGTMMLVGGAVGALLGRGFTRA